MYCGSSEINFKQFGLLKGLRLKPAYHLAWEGPTGSRSLRTGTGARQKNLGLDILGCPSSSQGRNASIPYFCYLPVFFENHLIILSQYFK